MTESSPRLMELGYHERRNECFCSGKGEGQKDPAPARDRQGLECSIWTNYKPEQPCVSREPHYHSDQSKSSHSPNIQGPDPYLIYSFSSSFAVEVSLPREVLLLQPPSSRLHRKASHLRAIIKQQIHQPKSNRGFEEHQYTYPTQTHLEKSRQDGQLHRRRSMLAASESI